MVTRISTHNPLRSPRGFTLVEIMIALAIGGVIMAAVMTSFNLQHRTYLNQDEVVTMQQNVRLAMDMLARDIRLAGYNPTRQAGVFTFVNDVTFNNEAGTLPAQVFTDAARIAFLSDLNGDGEVNLEVEDVNGDGIRDMSDMEQIAFRLNAQGLLQRYSLTTGAIIWQTVAENIEEIEFFYLLAGDPPTATTAPIADELPLIRGVLISLLARTANPDPRHTDAVEYVSASGEVWGPYGDGFRRRLLIQTVFSRNMGLLP